MSQKIKMNLDVLRHRGEKQVRKCQSCDRRVCSKIIEGIYEVEGQKMAPGGSVYSLIFFLTLPCLTHNGSQQLKWVYIRIMRIK